MKCQRGAHISWLRKIHIARRVEYNNIVEHGMRGRDLQFNIWVEENTKK